MYTIITIYCVHINIYVHMCHYQLDVNFQNQRAEKA